jgi:predicted metal-binding membrane protein
MARTVTGSYVTTTAAGRSETRGLAPAYDAVRARLGLVAILLAVAAAGWWWTAGEMSGMDNGPWSDIGTFGWFLSVWVVMMAAMMVPSVAPTIALYSRMTSQRSPLPPVMFTVGYLGTWALAGVMAFAIGVTANRAGDHPLSWDHAGRWVAGVTVIVAAVYELTPLKDVCLGKCRSPLGFLLASWRDGRAGAVAMGAKNGAWCVGCCWALMASLFALGIMSIPWMAVVAALIALEKMLPWRRVAAYTIAAFLLGLGVLLLASPSSIPALTTPASTPMQQMPRMGS